ncbi:hypothetical protein K8B83_14770 [Shewanella inventionis]|uniref:hypothetical protein n=1 Tax=Shewanella inventionis TaxID=1738770 RepID=UPI001CBFBFFA|nr:hypothetical protein [Shewanella inventionis]UAL42139.1 hypothetical protein K8B83_14770 [Shewanella inventionis]
MPIKIETNGLNKLKKNLEDLHGTHKVELSDILTPEFLGECSSFSDLNQLFIASGFDVKNPEDFKAIPDDEWEAFITNNTTFNSWEKMQQAAMNKYVHSRITEGLKK